MTRSYKLAAMAAALGLTPLCQTARADEACQLALRTKVQPIFNANCVACHQDAAPGGGLSLQRTSVPASLLGVPSQGAKLPRVTPGDPKRSYLFLKISGAQRAVGGSGERMPMGGRLVDDDIRIIATWITGCKGQ